MGQDNQDSQDSQDNHTLPQPDKTGHETVNSDLPKFLQAGRTSSLLLAFGGSLLLVAVVSLLFGRQIGYHQGESHATEQAKIEAGGEEVTPEAFKALKTKAETLQNSLVTTQQERDISLNNLEELRLNEQELKVTNLQLQQNDEIFTKLLAKQGGIPLQIIGAKIEPLPENAYEYRYDVAMLDRNNEPRRLTPKMTLLDEVNMVEVPMEPKSYDIRGITRVRGRFVMPAGFVPKQVKVEFDVSGEHIEKIYNWQLGKPVDNLPYSLAEAPETDKSPVASTDSSADTTDSPATHNEVAEQSAPKSPPKPQNTPKQDSNAKEPNNKPDTKSNSQPEPKKESAKKDVKKDNDSKQESTN